MVRPLTDVSKPPFSDEIMVVDGKLTSHFYEFINQLSQHNEKTNEGIFNYSRFANEAAVKLVIQNPDDGDTVMFTGQGLGTYNTVEAKWLLSADDTTEIT